MFEQFTTEARRALFFARMATAERSGEDITPEDLMKGLLFAGPEAVIRFAASAESLRPAETGAQWAERLESNPIVSAHVSREIPFTSVGQQVLRRTIQECDALGHKFVRPEHLLLGLLRSEGSEACETLHRSGVNPREVRRILASEPDTGETPPDYSQEFPPDEHGSQR